MREEVGWKKAGDSVPGRRLEIDRDIWGVGTKSVPRQWVLLRGSAGQEGDMDRLMSDNFPW